MRGHDSHVFELRGGDLYLEVGAGEISEDVELPAREEGEDVIVVAGPARDGVYAIIEDITAGYEPDLIKAALLQRLMLCPGLLSDERGGHMADVNIAFGWICQDILSLQPVAHCLLEVKAVFVKLGSINLERWRLVLLPK